MRKAFSTLLAFLFILNVIAFHSVYSLIPKENVKGFSVSSLKSGDFSSEEEKSGEICEFQHGCVQRYRFDNMWSIQKLPNAIANSKSPIEISRKLQNIFLPFDYPGSVPPEYLKFQKYDLLQDLTSYLRNIMTTHAILVSLGVGSPDSSPLQATIQWILKDGISMIIGLFFSTINSQRFGVDIKKWRLFADLIVDVGITFEMLAPYFPRNYFLILVSMGSICKCLCGIAAGAANAGIFQHFSMNGNNLSDIIAKNQAQHTVVALFGLCLTILFTKLVPYLFPNLSLTNLAFQLGFDEVSANQIRFFQICSLWVGYLTLTSIHIFCNYRAVKILTFTTFNQQTFEIFMQRILNMKALQHLWSSNISLGSEQLKSFRNELQDLQHLLTPRAIGSAETIIGNFIQKSPKVKIQNSFEDFQHLYESTSFTFGQEFLKDEISLASSDKFLTFLRLRHGFIEINIAYEQNSTSRDYMKAIFEASILKKLFLERETIYEGKDCSNTTSLFSLRKLAKEITNWMYPSIPFECLGWNIVNSRLKVSNALILKWSNET